MVLRRAKKVFKRNDKQYKDMMDHVGRFPAVIIAPDDSELIQGGSEVRKFLDIVISQYDKSYPEALVGYNSTSPKE